MDRFPIIIPRLDRRIQLKISKLLIFLVVFLDTVVKPRYDTEHIFRSTQQCLRGNDIHDPCGQHWSNN
ncbi:MAG: palindromic element RPE4 domain-containing protein [Rickettsia endosymbiont of Argas persicus]